MTTSTRVLLVPGRGDSGQKHWQTIWQRTAPDYERVVQREWHNPDRDEWVQTLDAAIHAHTSPVVLVAHSLAVATVVHWASRRRGPVVGALLVAPSDVEHADYPAGTTGFAPLPLTQLPFNAIVVASTNDPRVSLERARFFAQSWGALLQVLGEFGHLGSDADLGSWPYGAALLQRLLQGQTIAVA